MSVADNLAGAARSGSTAVDLDENPFIGWLYADVGGIPFWLVLVKVVAIFVFLVLMTLLTIVFERKVVGWMQVRPGPNRVGPWGMLQSLADGLKLAFKEDIMPKAADKAVYFIAPVVACVPALMAFAVMPTNGCSAFSYCACPSTNQRIPLCTSLRRFQNNSCQSKLCSNPSKSSRSDTTTSPSSSSCVSASRTGLRRPSISCASSMTWR